jgi:hypothetical protein
MAVTAAERASFRSAVGAKLAQLAREIAREKDIAARELAVATDFARLFVDLDEDLIGEIFDIVAEAPGGRAVLEAVSVAGETGHAIRARVRLEELGPPESAPATLRVVRANELLAEGEPVSALSLLCEREGASGAQAFSFVLDYEVTRGAVKAGFVTDLGEGNRVMGMVGRRPDRDLTDLVDVDPAEAHARLVEAAKQGARDGLAPDDDGLIALRIFLRASGEPDADAIVQALELGRSLTDVVDERIAEALEALVEPMLEEADAWFSENVDDPDRAVEGAGTLALMADFAAGYALVWFQDWSTDLIDELMLGWMPRMTRPEEDASTVGFEEAFRFLIATGRMPVERGAIGLARVGRNAKEFRRAMADRSRRGPAGLIAAAMAADGVDLVDQDAVQAWIEEFNAGPIERRDAILGPRPGADGGAGAASASRSSGRKQRARKAQKAARRRNRGR